MSRETLLGAAAAYSSMFVSDEGFVPASFQVSRWLTWWTYTEEHVDTDCVLDWMEAVGESTSAETDWFGRGFPRVNWPVL